MAALACLSWMYSPPVHSVNLPWTCHILNTKQYRFLTRKASFAESVYV